VYARDARHEVRCWPHIRVVPVYCSEQDFVAGGKWGSAPWLDTAVFTEYEIKPKDWAEAIKP